MLLENDYLYEDKTGLENIKLYGVYFDYGLDSYQKYSDLLEITNDLGRNVSTYSKGMKRKLSLLIIVMMNREIIFLDEVTSGVDPISRVEIRKLLDKNAALMSLMALSYKPLWIQLAKKGLKKTDVIAMAGLTTNVMAQMGKDKPIRFKNLEKICKALSCTPNDIISFEYEFEKEI